MSSWNGCEIGVFDLKGVLVVIHDIEKLRRCKVHKSVPEEIGKRQQIVVKEEEGVVDKWQTAKKDWYDRSSSAESWLHPFAKVLVVVGIQDRITFVDLVLFVVVGIHRKA